jgi:ribonuclease D
LERQARLKRLLEYREKLARAINRPRQWIFDNEAAVALVSEPMLDPDQIVALLARQRSFPRSERERFPVWMAEPLSAEELDIEPAPAQFEGDERRRADQLKLAVDQRAAELDLPPALLAPRRLIEAIVRGDDAPELQGWRGEALRSLL